MNLTMKFGNRMALASLATLAITLTAPHLAQAEEFPWTVGLGFEFASGKYGTSNSTESVFVPFTLAVRPTSRLELSVEIPFVYQSNNSVVSGVVRNGMQGNKTTLLPAGGMGGSGFGANGLSPSSTATSLQSESGIGDITVKAGYVLVEETDLVPQVRPTAFVKFPTADKNKALGTGEFDEGFTVEFSKWLGNWNPFMEAGYTVQGKAEQLALRNYMTYNAGLGYQLTESIKPIILVKGATPPADGTSSLLEARLKLNYQATRQTGIETYIAKGITTNSPDYGAGLAVYYDF